MQKLKTKKIPCRCRVSYVLAPANKNLLTTRTFPLSLFYTTIVLGADSSRFPIPAKKIQLSLQVVSPWTEMQVDLQVAKCEWCIGSTYRTCGQNLPPPMRPRLTITPIEQIINSYYSNLVNIVYSFGGDIIKIAGDALYCIFMPDESDLRGAVLCAALCSMQLKEVNVFRYAYTYARKFFVLFLPFTCTVVREVFFAIRISYGRTRCFSGVFEDKKTHEKNYG